MNHPRAIVAGALTALLLSSAAFAGSTGTTTTTTTSSPSSQTATATPAAKCSALQAQWQKEGMAQKSNANFAKAEKSANAGMKLCTAGKSQDGIVKLKAALKEIGLKPAV